jgi:mersacidin/lichenicidin family type 2 lantibiotic
MSNTEVVRAWKDPEYRAMLSEVPALPIGSIELDDPYLGEKTLGGLAFGFRKGEHTTITGCGHCHTFTGCTHNCTHNCSADVTCH